MKEKLLFSLLIFINCSLFAQIKGIVKDSLTGNPIPYVTIWVENENIGSTTEENGTFSINTSNLNKNLWFSTLGYEKKKVKTADANVVQLKPTSYTLDEIIISKSIGTRALEIGKTKTEVYQAFDNGPKIDTKFFPYNPIYKKTKYLKQVSIYTDSRIEKAIIKLHFYNVDSNGFPAEELLDKDFIVTVKKGTGTNRFDLTEFNLLMPKKGLFVGFEKLMVEKNKTQKVITNYITNKPEIQKTYFPFVVYNYVEKEFQYTYSGGKWNKKTKQNDANSSGKLMVYEPSINLILTN